MPTYVASDIVELSPILILEDLSHYYWPPPWSDKLIDLVVETIASIHDSNADLPAYEALHGAAESNWRRVMDDVEPFLNLGLASKSWLDYSLPYLINAESSCQTEGNAVTHLDIRRDNICIDGVKVKLIDWNNTCLSNPKLDLGFWMPSLVFEGGPEPESILGEESEIAAFVTGFFFAARAGLPDIPDAPHVRLVQRQQLGPALSWVTRALNLPPLMV